MRVLGHTHDRATQTLWVHLHAPDLLPLGQRAHEVSSRDRSLMLPATKRALRGQFDAVLLPTQLVAVSLNCACHANATGEKEKDRGHRAPWCEATRLQDGQHTTCYVSRKQDSWKISAPCTNCFRLVTRSSTSLTTTTEKDSFYRTCCVNVIDGAGVGRGRP